MACASSARSSARGRILWLPDVFGYPASLPQILQGCGLRDFYTNKLHWQARNLFPVNLFWWEGIDGTRVLAHIPKLHNDYNGWPNPEQLLIGWDNFQQKAVYDELLLPFGFGDGGGGPTEEMLEFAARAARSPACRRAARAAARRISTTCAVDPARIRSQEVRSRIEPSNC